MSTETMIRKLKKFKVDGLINMSGKDFSVIDKSKLKRISEKG